MRQLHEEPVTCDVDHGIFFHVLAFNKCNYGDVDHGIFSMSYFLINVIISLQLHGCDE